VKWRKLSRRSRCLKLGDLDELSFCCLRSYLDNSHQLSRLPGSTLFPSSPRNGRTEEEAVELGQASTLPAIHLCCFVGILAELPVHLTISKARGCVVVVRFNSVILSKRSLRGEGSERAARNPGACPESAATEGRVWLASVSNRTTTAFVPRLTGYPSDV
jgi:hypothetical protein